MKTKFTLLLALATSILYAQDCGPITTGYSFVHGNIQFNILNEGQAMNELNYKIGIGPDGDLSTREYAPVIKSNTLWAGGKDPNGSINLAVGNYSTQDWSTGPLDTYGQTNEAMCEAWDQIFTVTKEEILEARRIYLEGGPCEDIPESVRNWPGRNNGSLPFMGEFKGADFWDENLDAEYNACKGDLPWVFTGQNNFFEMDGFFKRLPSKLSYYVINGNNKATMAEGGLPVQLALGVYVMSFETEEVKDIVFMKYHSTSHTSDDLMSFHLGNWYDFDLGCPENDFIGTDVERNMLYVYNSNEENCDNDGQPLPSSQFGISILNGMLTPYLIETIDGKDTLIVPPFGTGTTDTLVHSKMATSVIPTDCDNGTSNICNPQNAIEYYNILNGKNKDGSALLDDQGNETITQFTGNPSEDNDWSLCTASNLPQTTALITSESKLLRPGARNNLIMALFHTTDSGGDGCPNLAALMHRQEEAQKFFYSGFFHITGPQPPTLIITQESDQVKINIEELPYEYAESIPDIPGPNNGYFFEGIKIFQVASPDFDFTELNNPELSHLIYQGDIENGIEDISNFETTFENGVKIYKKVNKVMGNNEGIADEVIFDYDHLEDQEIIAGKAYYFVAVSYAYNSYEKFDIETESGQQYPYLEGSCGVSIQSSQMTLSHSESYPTIPYRFFNSGSNWRVDQIKEPLLIRLISASGSTIQRWEQSLGSQLNSYDINDLPIGIYFLHIEGKHSKTSNTHKLVAL
ncbi:MAG: hypothetical protein AAGA77_19990 [Bacteroidota bacterium]